MLLNVKSCHAYVDDTAIAICPYGGIKGSVLLIDAGALRKLFQC